jgi:hypothetical protein
VTLASAALQKPDGIPTGCREASRNIAKNRKTVRPLKMLLGINKLDYGNIWFPGTVKRTKKFGGKNPAEKVPRQKTLKSLVC